MRRKITDQTSCRVFWHGPCVPGTKTRKGIDMSHRTDKRRNTSSQILPIVIAAFAGATLAIACERPDSRASARNGADGASPQVPAAPRPTAEAPAQVRPMPAPETLTDTVITTRIKTAILTDPGMAGADVSVNTDRGVVTLVGNVKSHEQTGIASAHAQRQDGVMRVDNQLSYEPK
jgi:hypothetical protein